MQGDMMKPVRRFEPDNVLDPRHYDGVRRPFDTAETLPAWCYTSPAFYQREVERIFHKYWNCIGHESRVPEAGSYLALDFLDVPIVVVRGEDMKLRAFVNSCAHRGSRIMDGAGACNMLKCPYHNWTFDLTGALVATPLVEESEVFRKADHPLIPIRLETWAGQMWINLDPDAQDLLSYLGDLPERCAPWQAEDMVCAFTVSREVKANWKLINENFSDGYHVPFVHRGSIARTRVSKRDRHDPQVNKGEYLMHFTRFQGTRGIADGQKRAPDIDLPDELKTGTFFPQIHANARMGFSIDSVLVAWIYPTGPESCINNSSLLFPRATVALPEFETEILPAYRARQEQVLSEDCAAVEGQQKGLRSPIHKPGRFTPEDPLVHDYDLWILDRVLANA